MLGNCVGENISLLTEDVPSDEDLYDFFGQCFDNSGDAIEFPLTGSNLSTLFKGCYDQMRASELGQ